MESMINPGQGRTILELSHITQQLDGGLDGNNMTDEFKNSMGSAVPANGTVTPIKTDFLALDKNLFDGSWELGGFVFGSGAPTASSVSTREVDFTVAEHDTTYYFSNTLYIPDVYIFEYTTAGAFIKYTKLTYAFNHTLNRFVASLAMQATTGKMKVFLYNFTTADIATIKMQMELTEATVYSPHRHIPTGTFSVPVDSQIAGVKNCKDLDFSTSPTMYNFKKFVTTDWEVGGMDASGNNQVAKYRIRTAGYVTPSDKLHIKLLDKAFRYLVKKYQADGTYVSESGWVTTDLEYEYATGYKYRILIGRVTENESETATTAEFAAVLTIGEGIIKNNTVDILGQGKRYLGITARIGAGLSNTLEAIKQAALGGAWGVEIDCRITADNNVVLHHAALMNDNTDETAGKYVYEYTLAEIQAFNVVQSGYTYYDYDIKVPSLDDALDMCRKYGVVPYLDIKCDQTYEITNKATLFNTIITKLLAKNMLYRTVFVFETLYKADFTYIRDSYPDAWIAYKHTTSTVTIANALLNAKAMGGNLIMQPEPAETWVTDDEAASETSAARLLAYHNVGFPVVGDDIIMTYGTIPAGYQKGKYAVSTQIATTDTGATWAASGQTVGETVTVTATTLGGKNALNVVFSGVASNEIYCLNPQLVIDNISDFSIDVKCRYDTTAKKLLIAFFSAGSQIDFSNLPASFSFRMSVIF
jgi:hypothetical protein